jgi:hypothetical protein
MNNAISTSANGLLGALCLPGAHRGEHREAPGPFEEVKVDTTTIRVAVPLEI